MPNGLQNNWANRSPISPPRRRWTTKCRRGFKKHQSERPAHWQTLEIPLDVAAHVGEIKSDLVILDCMTLLTTNLLMKLEKKELVDEGPFTEAVYKEVADLLAAIRAGRLGLDYHLERDRLGACPALPNGTGLPRPARLGNERLAREADKVTLFGGGDSDGSEGGK